MSGHNKWSQIKHQKGATDKKRGVIFSKIIKALSVAARDEPNPAFNPRLRNLLLKARESAVPSETIERAIKKTQDAEGLKELLLEAYGPGGVAFLIYTITDNRNRTIRELRRLLDEQGGKLAEQGSVRWAFDGDQPKFPQSVSIDDEEKIKKLSDILEAHNDVQKIITNAFVNPKS